MIKIKNVLGIITFSISLTCGANHQETPPSKKYLESCVEWVVQKFVAGAELEKSLAYPTESNISEMLRIFSQTGHQHLVPEDPK